MLLVVAGPSGVGKGTLLRGLLEREPNLWFSVSATTRVPRAGEVNGVDYWFVTRDDFERVRDDGGFLEWFEVYGDLKGTPLHPIETALADGQDVLLEVDVQGALAVRDVMPGAVLVFVRSPSADVQRARLLRRGSETPDSVERRLATAAIEENQVDRFDHVVVNEEDQVEQGVERLAAILAGHRADPDPAPSRD